MNQDILILYWFILGQIVYVTLHNFTKLINKIRKTIKQICLLIDISNYYINVARTYSF